MVQRGGKRSAFWTFVSSKYETYCLPPCPNPPPLFADVSVQTLWHWWHKVYLYLSTVLLQTKFIQLHCFVFSNVYTWRMPRHVMRCTALCVGSKQLNDRGWTQRSVICYRWRHKNKTTFLIKVMPWRLSSKLMQCYITCVTDAGSGHIKRPHDPRAAAAAHHQGLSAPPWNKPAGSATYYQGTVSAQW